MATGPVSLRLTRRGFFGLASTAALAALAACRREAAGNATTSGRVVDTGPVTVIDFDDKGIRKGLVEVPKFVKTDAEWRAQLSRASYEITRREGTEPPFTGDLLNEHGRGVFRCICCDTALFNSDTKFDSGTGWPSFWQPIAKENVNEIMDSSLFMVRVAVSCRRCDAHLGHVFDDGPKPTGLRYCINSVALKFNSAPASV